MDNCGGGQRLPPDGDEFPAAYQEFSATTSQQYQLVAPQSNSNKSHNIYDCKKTSKSFMDHSEEARHSTQYIVTNNREMTITSSEIIPGKLNNSHTQRNTSSSYTSNGNNDTLLVMSEKKIEIAGYYPKELSRMEIDSLGGDKDYPDCTPPPLPLTGPPKLDKPVSLGRSVSTDNSSRKFSLNGDPRRQDDKSEKSVRDKIAMFSSQSNLEAPLFPTSPITSNVVTNSGRRLSKYKSTEDFFDEEKIQRDRTTSLVERTLSSCDLTVSKGVESNYEKPPSLPQSSPPDDDDVDDVDNNGGSNEEKKKKEEIYRHKFDHTMEIKSTSKPINLQIERKDLIQQPIRTTMPVLTRATSFSGGISTNNNDLLSTSNGQISRANSLASTFRRNSEDMRRTSLNHLIEQRRKGISKLRGLVIPEKESVPIDQPIIDLPEIKSRDSIFVHQMPKASIQDKWGSQSSLASNASTQSVPLKTTFKMPAPQILPKYSPAFKRKSLTVYGSTSANNFPSNSSTQQSVTQTNSTNTTASDAPKSLESICSPTRSDYSFEYVSSSISPENLRNRARPSQRKTRADYDDSDNDSAVSSQSSISRGFSPSTSPVPSNVSSDRSYSMSLIMEMPSRNYIVNNDRGQFNSKPLPYPTTYREESNRSSSDSSSTSNSTSRCSPPPDHNSPYTAIPQRQMLKRSSSTETNYSTSSSTLTSGSQASAESLSRRVLKPQSVEAINRKNILASAKCRSGQNLNGSPLIQRKFSDDEEIDGVNGTTKMINELPSNGNIKIAYVEVIDDFSSEKEHIQATTLPCKSMPTLKQPLKSEIEPSNDLKMWVRTEAKSLMVKNNTRMEMNHNESSLTSKVPRSISTLSLNDTKTGNNKPFNEFTENDKQKSVEDDLIATLTRSRSRAPINLEDGAVLLSKSQMSLEDILSGKVEPKIMHLEHSTSYGRLSMDSRDGKLMGKMTLNESSNKEKTFVSKIPTFGRKTAENNIDEMSNNGTCERMRNTKIPMQKSLGRRSASVTDMKKAIDKIDYTALNHYQSGASVHQRFSSLDSSVGGNNRMINGDSDVERFYGEQFGSISSLASSTSLISQQELALLVEEASLEDTKGAHDIIVVLLHKENPSGSVGITLAGGIDCEAKEITVHRVLAHSIADKDGRVQRGDRILSINGRSTRGLGHRESLGILKQPRTEVVLVVSRARVEEGQMRARTDSVETIVEGFETHAPKDAAWGPPTRVTIFKDGAGLGFSLEGGRDSPLGDKPLVVKKVFTGGAAEKAGALTAGDQLLEVNGDDVTRMSRIEAWSLMKKLHDGEVSLLVRHPATKSS